MLTMFAYAKGRGIRAGSVRGVLPYETSARDSLRSTSYIRVGGLLVRRSLDCLVSLMGSGSAATVGGVMCN